MAWNCLTTPPFEGFGEFDRPLNVVGMIPRNLRQCASKFRPRVISVDESGRKNKKEEAQVFGQTLSYGRFV